VLSVGNPIHGLLFASAVHGGGHDLPVAIHIVRDGLLALTANETLAVILATRVLGRTMLLTSRRLPLSRPVAVEPR
jgi:hypothetical protein